jgi:hypothetical protein
MQIMRRSFTEKIILRADGFQLSEEIKIIAFKYFKSLEVEGRYYRRIGKSKLNAFNHGLSNLNYLFVFRKLQKLAVALPINPLTLEALPLTLEALPPSVDETLPY